MHDLAAQEPERLQELINLWYAEAGANGAFPLDDRGALEIILTPRPLLSPPRNRYVYYPGLADVPESQAVNIRNRSYAIGALVDIPGAGRARACCSRTARASAATRSTSRTTGCTTSTASSAASSRRSSPTEELPTGEKLILSAAFEKEGEDPPGVAVGTLSLYHGDVKVGEGRIKTQPGKFSLAGDGLCVGRDSSDPVTDDYPGDGAVGVHRRHDQPRRRRRQRRALRRPRARGRRDDVARVARAAARVPGAEAGGGLRRRRRAGGEQPMPIQLDVVLRRLVEMADQDPPVRDRAGSPGRPSPTCARPCARAGVVCAPPELVSPN